MHILQICEHIYWLIFKYNIGSAFLKKNPSKGSHHIKNKDYVGLARCDNIQTRRKIFEYANWPRLKIIENLSFQLDCLINWLC